MVLRRFGAFVAGFALLATLVVGVSSATEAGAIGEPLALGSALPDVAAGDSTWVKIPVSGGTAPYTWTVVSTTYPTALQVRDGGYLVGLSAPSATYSVTLRVADAAGASATRALSLRVLPPTAPGAPWLSTLDATPGGARLTWSANETGGSPITGYVITPYRDGTAEAARPATEPRVTLGGLVLGASYRFTVAATNAIGTGPASRLSTAITPIDVPAAPFDVDVTIAGQPQQATVTWNATADAGHPITGFDIGYRSTAGGPVQWYTSALDGAARTVTMWAENGAPRFYVVRAKNDVGLGDWSADGQPHTAWGLPSKPVVGPARATTSGASPALAVSWTPTTYLGAGATTSFVVRVNDAAAQEFHEVTVSAGSTSVVVPGLTFGKSYQARVSAVSEEGEGEAGYAPDPVSFSVPAAPAFPSAQPGDGSARLTWWPVAANGYPVVDATITPIRNGVAGTPTVVTGSAPSATLTGLVRGDSYAFRIVLRNAAGSSPAATTAPVVIGAPAAPASVQTVGGATSVQVTWAASLPNGAPVQGYRITPVQGSTPLATITFDSTATTQTVPGLEAGTSYTFQVAAYNTTGTGPSIRTEPVVVGAPLAPSSVRAEQAARGVRIQVAPPVDNGSPVIAYRVEILDAAGAGQGLSYVEATDVLAIDTYLEPGRTFRFRVQAENARGFGPWATSNSLVAGAPPPPATLSARTGNASAVVSWSAPDPNGWVVSSYVITPYLGSVAQPSKTVEAPATSATVTGLTNGEDYTFRIEAANVNGRGLPSIASAAVRVGVPSAPGRTTATPGDRAALVAPGSVTANGGPVTGYVVTPVLGTTARPAQRFSASAPLRVTGLTNAAAYTFVVQAVNRYGTGAATTTAALRIGTPLAPTKASAAAKTRSALVSWAAPASDNGARVTRYFVTPYIGSEAQPTQVFDASATRRTITGLKKGTAYTFRIRAVNSRGASPMSSATRAVTPT